MGRRSVHSPEELRQLILNASQSIIERNGITGLSAREIARAIGYSPGTLYNIFENLDDVLVKLQIRLLERVHDNLKQVPIGPDSAANIQALCDAYVNFALDNRKLWNLLFAHAMPAGTAAPQAIHDTVNNIAEVVKAGVAPLAPGISADELDAATRALWAGVHGITAIAVTEKGPHMTTATAIAFARLLTSTFLRGLTAR